MPHMIKRNGKMKSILLAVAVIAVLAVLTSCGGSYYESEKGTRTAMTVTIEPYTGNGEE